MYTSWHYLSSYIGAPRGCDAFLYGWVEKRIAIISIMQMQAAKTQCLVSQGNTAQPNLSSLIMAHLENILLPIIM